MSVFLCVAWPNAASSRSCACIKFCFSHFMLFCFLPGLCSELGVLGVIWSNLIRVVVCKSIFCEVLSWSAPSSWWFRSGLGCRFLSLVRPPCPKMSKIQWQNSPAWIFRANSSSERPSSGLGRPLLSTRELRSFWFLQNPSHQVTQTNQTLRFPESFKILFKKKNEKPPKLINLQTPNLLLFQTLHLAFRRAGCGGASGGSVGCPRRPGSRRRSPCRPRCGSEDRCRTFPRPGCHKPPRAFETSKWKSCLVYVYFVWFGLVFFLFLCFGREESWKISFFLLSWP